MWVSPHPFLCRLKHSAGIDSTNEVDLFQKLGLLISAGAADTLDEP